MGLNEEDTWSWSIFSWKRRRNDVRWRCLCIARPSTTCSSTRCVSFLILAHESIVWVDYYCCEAVVKPDVRSLSATSKHAIGSASLTCPQATREKCEAWLIRRHAYPIPNDEAWMENCSVLHGSPISLSEFANTHDDNWTSSIFNASTITNLLVCSHSLPVVHQPFITPVGHMGHYQRPGSLLRCASRRTSVSNRTSGTGSYYERQPSIRAQHRAGVSYLTRKDASCTSWDRPLCNGHWTCSRIWLLWQH